MSMRGATGGRWIARSACPVQRLDLISSAAARPIRPSLTEDIVASYQQHKIVNKIKSDIIYSCCSKHLMHLSTT